MTLRNHLVATFVKDTLGVLPMEHLDDTQRKLLTSGLSEMFAKIAVNAVLESLPEARRIEFLSQLRSGAQQKRALKKLYALIPAYSLPVQNAIRKQRAEFLETYESETVQQMTVDRTSVLSQLDSEICPTPYKPKAER